MGTTWLVLFHIKPSQGARVYSDVTKEGWCSALPVVIRLDQIVRHPKLRCLCRRRRLQACYCDGVLQDDC